MRTPDPSVAIVFQLTTLNVVVARVIVGDVLPIEVMTPPSPLHSGFAQRRHVTSESMFWAEMPRMAGVAAVPWITAPFSMPEMPREVSGGVPGPKKTVVNLGACGSAGSFSARTFPALSVIGASVVDTISRVYVPPG